MRALTDDVGNRVLLRKAVQRAVTLSPCLTDSVQLLGAGDRLVGTSDVCSELRGRVTVGPERHPDIERIVALQPDVVFACADRTEEEALDSLANAGVNVFRVLAKDIAGALRLVETLGALLGAERAARDHVAESRAIIARAERRVGGKSRPSVLCLAWKDPLCAVGMAHYVRHLIVKAGGVNAAPASIGDFSPLGWNAIGPLNPQVILLPDYPYPFIQQDIDELFIKVGCSATLDGRVHLVPGHMLFWPGMRVAEGVRVLAELIHP